ncbi:MAG TPA: ATP-binding protein [Steroidobacteraceae bacterium]|nr:ATP-binding protein [Steroidobacteraceae bacterium]
MSTAVPDSPDPERQFLRDSRSRIDHELFMARFANWRMSVLAALVVGGALGGLYYYLTGSRGPLLWAVLYCITFVVIGATCWVYERRPAPAGSALQQRWVLVWAVLSGLCGAASGALPRFLPADRGLQLSAAAIQSIVMLSYVVTRGHRRIIYAIVAGQTLVLASALLLHARLPLAVPVCVVFAICVLVFGLKLNDSTRAAIGQRLYALQLSERLAAAHRQQLRVQQLESVLNERRRMMGEMHDGFGSTLLSSLMSLERGHLSVADAAAVLRECVDDLRLMVDAQEPAARDLSTLLGMLRYRLQRRIQAAGVQLNWNMGDLMQRKALEPTQSLELLRILQEAVTNALRHSGARNIEIAVRQVRSQIEVCVQDDGQGFNAAAVAGGRGIGSMQARTGRLGASLTIESEQGAGTVVTVVLPPPRMGS